MSKTCSTCKHLSSNAIVDYMDECIKLKNAIQVDLLDPPYAGGSTVESITIHEPKKFGCVLYGAK